MKKLKSIIIVAAICAAFVINLPAQEKPAGQEISPAKKALILEYLEVTGLKKNTTEITDVMLTFQEQEASKTILALAERDQELSPELKKQMAADLTKSSARMYQRLRTAYNEKLKFPQLLEEIALSTYDKHFSENELREMIAFYKTPTGQKMISSSPKVMQEVMTAISEKISPKVLELVKEISEAEFTEMRKTISVDH